MKKTPQIPPLIGVQTFRKLQLTLMAAARKKKDGGSSTSGIGDPPSAAIQSELVTPAPQVAAAGSQDMIHAPISGLNYVIDNEGGFLPDSNPEEGDDAVPKELEAEILMGVQKQIGFNYEVGDDVIQHKLMELDSFDKEKNVELVQERGYP
jgi:hypothetical protein